MEENQIPKPERRKTSNLPRMLLFVFFGGVVVALILHVANMPISEPARREPCVNKLKQIGLALHYYHDEYGSFPPAYTVDDSGKPLHSWRTLLLPYLELESLYKKIELNEPWNSPDNLAVYQDAFVDAYLCPCFPSDKHDATSASYVMVTGPECISDGPSSRSLEEIESLAGNTWNVICVIETNTPVCWYEPKDLKFEEIDFKVNDGKSPGIGSYHAGVAIALFCDASVHPIDDGIDPEDFRAMFEVSKDPSWGSAMGELHEKANH